MKFNEYLKSGIENKGLHILLHEMKYKDRCEVPNKLPIFEFCRKNKIPYAKLLWSGNIKDVDFSRLPENFCLKPSDGCTSRGVFLMYQGKNLRTGKKYNNLDEIKDDYVEESKQNIGYSLDCYVETLHEDKGIIPEDISVFMIGQKVGCILQARRIGKEKVKIFYNSDFEIIDKTGEIEKPDFVPIVKDSKKIMKSLGVPFMRIDFYSYSGKHFLGELTPVSGISGTLSDSFKELKLGRKIDKYLGFMFESSFENPFKKFDRIVVINLPECQDRLERFQKMAAEYEFQYEIFEAVKHEVGSWGCSQSHLEIIKQAKKDNLKNVLVFEDDACFVYPKFYVWNEVNRYFKTKCDVFYLGCIAAWNTESEIINGKEIEYKSVLGRHALVYNSSFFDHWINTQPTFEEFKKSRDVRGDVKLALAPVVKKGCFPVAAVCCSFSRTGTNAMKIEKPLESGRDHMRLILAAYASKGLLDYPMLRKEIKNKLFEKSEFLEKRIRQLFLMCDPFMFVEDTRYINLFKDSDRMELTEKMFSDYDIKAKRFNAIANKNGWAGSTLSHRGCILWAKMMNRENVLIFEDDAVFIEDPEKMKKMFMQAIYDCGNDYDILYLGLSLTAKAKKINEDLYSVKGGWGAYAYLVNSRAYEKILRLLPSKPELITQEKRTVSDVIYFDKIQPDGKCFLTPLCSSRDNFSNNWERNSNDVYNKIIKLYNKYLENEKIVKKVYISDYPAVIEKHKKFAGPVKSHVINLESAKERLICFSQDQEETNLISRIKRPVAITDSRIIKSLEKINPLYPNEVARLLSNQLTFSDILADETAEKVIIFEDDCKYKPEFDEVLENILKELPDDFSVCFLGYYLRRNFKLKRHSKHLIEVVENTRKILGAHAILYNKKFYKKISDALKSPFSDPTDSEISKLLTGKEKVFIADPMICFQSGAESTIGHKLDFSRFERENKAFIDNNLTE